jgi:L-lysine 6-transaminase
MAAFDMPDDATRGKLFAEARENGMLILVCGERTIRFRPPLNLTKEEVDEGIDILDRSLNAVRG